MVIELSMGLGKVWPLLSEVSLPVQDNDAYFPLILPWSRECIYSSNYYTFPIVAFVFKYLAYIDEEFKALSNKRYM